MNLNNFKKVHFIGIASSFSSFAVEYLLSKNIQVTASEFDQKNENSKIWIQRGILYEGGHNESYISSDLDLVVTPNGEIPNNPEVAKAVALGLPMMKIGKLIGEISKQFKTIAIAGTHGKTTTTALMVWGLNGLDKLPNFIAGGAGDNIAGINKSYNYDPESEFLVLEACEYKAQFLERAPKPYISVITHVELDHTDYFRNIDHYIDTFVEFCDNSEYVVLDIAEVNSRLLAKRLNNSVNIINVQTIESEKLKFNLPYFNTSYNQANAAKVITVLRLLGFSEDKIVKVLSDFKGLAKRLEFITEINSNQIYFDYAHNPTKLKSLVQAILTEKIFGQKKVKLIWQPHSYERSYTFQEEFNQSIKGLTDLIIPNIYAPIREVDEFKSLITEQSFVNNLQQSNSDCMINFTNGFDEMDKYLLSSIDKEQGIVYIFASAGDLHQHILDLFSITKC